jgi:hypothetical protein
MENTKYREDETKHYDKKNKTSAKEKSDLNVKQN